GQACAKINQDRACVLQPFGLGLGSTTGTLICVFDGHGERGDLVR
ncbi:unnamed protein product, partial [Discosporangium mesarthrocarpum]